MGRFTGKTNNTGAEITDLGQIEVDPKAVTKDPLPLPEEEEEMELNEELLSDDMRQEIEKRYQIEKVLGQGGMGAVFLARDKKYQDRVVAIKIMRADHRGSDRAKKRFEIEAKGAARLPGHSNLTFVLDRGENESGSWVVTEYGGVSLESLLRKGPLPPHNALRVISGLTKGLMVTHQAGIIHRDIKPANILLPNAGPGKISEDTFEGAKLGDFGLLHIKDDPEIDKKYKKLAKELPPDEAKPKALAEYYEGMESRGVVTGTPLYMSPEATSGFVTDFKGKELKGKAEEEAMQASDVYSLGAMFYQILTGKPPFLGKTIQEMFINIVKTKAKPPHKLDKHIPKEMSDLIMAMLEKDYKKRPKTLPKKGEESLLDKLTVIEGELYPPEKVEPAPAPVAKKKSLLERIRSRWK